MSQDMVIALGKEAMYVVLLVAGPLLGVGLLVGLLISIFQATTHIQEQTLVFIPKIIAVFAGLVFFGPWILQILTDYVTRLFNSIPGILG